MARRVEPATDRVTQLVQRVLAYQRRVFNDSQIAVFQGPPSTKTVGSFYARTCRGMRHASHMSTRKSKVDPGKIPRSATRLRAVRVAGYCTLSAPKFSDYRPKHARIYRGGSERVRPRALLRPTESETLREGTKHTCVACISRPTNVIATRNVDVFWITSAELALCFRIVQVEAPLAVQFR